MENIVKEYTNGEVTIVWKPNLCTHASFCWRELPEVFDPQRRPWTNPQGASTQQIIKQVKRCPSGALTHYMNNEKNKTMEEKTNKVCGVAEVVHNGPLVVQTCLCVEQEGKGMQEHKDGAAFCRCSKSKNQPYCDGSHIGHPFE